MATITLRGSAKTNKVTMQMNGVKGPSCVGEIQRIVELSGANDRVTASENTSEYHEQAATQQVPQKSSE
jgi:hypothetical protein